MVTGHVRYETYSIAHCIYLSQSTILSIHKSQIQCQSVCHYTFERHICYIDANLV